MRKINFVTILVFLLGVVFVFIVPPFQSPDEPAHFYKAWGLANGSILCSEKNGVKGLYLPSDVVSLPIVMKQPNIVFLYDKKFDYSLIMKNLWKKVGSEKTFVEPSNLCSIIPFGYIPQTIGVVFTKLFYPSPLLSLYLSRLFNLIASVIIINIAINVIPLGKSLISVFVLMPMVIHQLASLNYDASHYAITFLFISLTFYFSFKRNKISKKEYLLYAIVSVFASQIKYVYMPILLLLFMLNRKKIGSLKRYLGYILLIFLINIIILGFSLVFFKDTRVVTGADLGIQVNTFFHNPIKFLSLLIYSLDTQFDFYLKSTLGKLGWLDYGLNNLTYFVIVFVFIWFVSSNESSNLIFSIRQRAVLLLTFIVQTVTIFLSLFIIWTPVASPVIVGVQGRNIISFLPLLFFTFYKSKINKYLFIVLLIIIYYFVFRSVAFRYW